LRAGLGVNAVDYYSGAAETFHASYGSDPNRLERLRVWGRFFDRYAAQATTAVDFGCGSGILACELAARGVTTLGIDGSAKMLEIATRVAEARGLTNLRFEQRQLPLVDRSGIPAADLVIASSVVEYLEDVDDALLSFSRSLTPDGVLIFSISNAESLSRKLVKTVYGLTRRPAYFGLIKHLMTPQAIDGAFRRAGLSTLEISYFGAADIINRALARVLAPARASNMLIAAARRTTVEC
jgi:SAM-dependent methyltransferase